MDALFKKNKILEALKEKKLDDAFAVVQDRIDMVVLQSEQKISNTITLVSISVTDSFCNEIFIYLGKVSDQKRSTMVELLNRLNSETSMVHYYLNNNGSIMAHIVYTSTPTNFDSEFFIDLLINSFYHIENVTHSQIMSELYSDSPSEVEKKIESQEHYSKKEDFKIKAKILAAISIIMILISLGLGGLLSYEPRWAYFKGMAMVVGGLIMSVEWLMSLINKKTP